MQVISEVKRLRWSAILVGLFCLVNFSQVLAQESIKLQGKILNGSLGGSFINIINKTTNIGTINSTSGAFEIAVNEEKALELMKFYKDHAPDFLQSYNLD